MRVVRSEQNGFGMFGGNFLEVIKVHKIWVVKG